MTPDAVFDGSRLWDDGLREERASAHGVDPDELEEFYAARNLLGRRVTTADVAGTVADALEVSVQLVKDGHATASRGLILEA